MKRDQNTQTPVHEIKSTSWIKLTIGSVALVSLLSACGGQTYSKEETMTAGNSLNLQNQTNTVTNPTPVPTPCGTCGGLPPVEYNFTLSGSRGTNPPADSVYISPTLPATDTLLKIRVTAGPAATFSFPGYEGYQIYYGCVRYKITVGNQEHVTAPLSIQNGINYNCPGAPQSEIVDFSGNFGTGSLHVKVSEVQSDFDCTLWKMGMIYGHDIYCTTRLMFKNQRATGSLRIQTDGHRAP